MSSSNFPGYLGEGLQVVASTTSQRTAVGSNAQWLAADDVLIDNRGTVDAYIHIGGGTVVATSLCVRVPAGQGVIFGLPPGFSHIAYIFASGTATLVMHFSKGQ